MALEVDRRCPFAACLAATRTDAAARRAMGRVLAIAAVTDGENCYRWSTSGEGRRR